MGNRFPRWSGALAISLVMLGLAGEAFAAEEKSSGPDSKVLDKQIYNTLRDVINRGAELFNNGDHAGCYRIFEGALLTVRPQLDHRPNLQKAIDTGLIVAERRSSRAQGAFALREVLDQIRIEVASGEVKLPPVVTTLWDRLGGEANVQRVVEDFVDLIDNDTKIDFFRGNKDKVDMPRLKKHLVDLLSEVSHGPYKYNGRDMKNIHKGMAVTDAQFDALVVCLKAALDKNTVKPADRDAVLKTIADYRPFIVEKKAEVKPPEDVAQVAGKITLAGQPVGGAEIQLVPRDGPQQNKVTSKTTADGTFDLSGVKPGRYTVLVGKPTDGGARIPDMYNDSSKSPLRVDIKKGNNNLEYHLAAEAEAVKPVTTKKVSGVVVHKGKPVPRAEIQLVPESDRNAKGYSAKLDDEGRFSLPSVKPDIYVIVIVKSTVAVPDEWKDAKTSDLIFDCRDMKQ